MWQKCPVCKGKGIIWNTGTSTSTGHTCPVCNGAKIINKLPKIKSSVLITDQEYVPLLNLNKLKHYGR